MGIHHFALSMVPREFFEHTSFPIPSVLGDDDTDRGENPANGWWSSAKLSSQILSRLRQLCSIDNSWGETEEFVTRGTWGSDLRIWRERGQIWQVTFRFSPVTDGRILLDQFIAIVRDANCLLLHPDTGLVIEPDDSKVAELLQDSPAVGFACDPQKALFEAARRTY